MDNEPTAVTMKEVFFHRDTMANGRRLLVYHTAIFSVSSLLASGVFYSAFLLQFGINIAGISVLAFMPYVASFFSLFSPAIIRRLKKRRMVLFCAKAVYYILQIGCTTLIPFICKTAFARTVGFCILLFTASLVDALFNPGYIDWHIKFVPNRVRSKYLSFQLALNNLFPYVVSLALSVIADGLLDTPQYKSVIVLVRILALIFAAVDCIILLLPKEFPYDTSEKKTSLADVFRIPLSDAKFRKTMFVYFLYQFYISINAGVLNAYYIDELKQNLTVINLTNALYGVTVLLFSGMWQRLIRKKGWFRCLYLSCFLIVPVHICMVFTNADNAWLLFPILRLAEHIPSIGRAVPASNLKYINTPEQDSSYYYSLSIPTGNLGTLAGLMFGSLVVTLFDNRIIPIGMGINYGQFLFLVQAILGAAFGLLALAWSKQLDKSMKKQ